MKIEPPSIIITRMNYKKIISGDLALDYNRHFHTSMVRAMDSLGFGWKLSVPFVTSKADKDA